LTDAHPQKPRPSTTLDSTPESTPVTRNKVCMKPGMLQVQRCTMWLDAYVGHNEERFLRRLIEDFVIPYSIQVSPTVGINRLPTEPRTGQLVALTSH
jgi:hypothetical protein